MKLEVSDELISAYLDGELNESQRERVEAALAADENLRQVVRELQLMRADLRGLPTPQLDDEFVQRVLERTLTRQSRQLDRWRWAFVAVTTVAASLLFLLAWGNLPRGPLQVGARMDEDKPHDLIAKDANLRDTGVMELPLSQSAETIAKQEARHKEQQAIVAELQKAMSEKAAADLPASGSAAAAPRSAGAGFGGGLGGAMPRFTQSEKNALAAIPGPPANAAAKTDVKSAAKMDVKSDAKMDAKMDARDRAFEPQEPLVIQVVVAEKDWPRYVASVVAHFASSPDLAAQRKAALGDAQRDALARQLDRKRVVESAADLSASGRRLSTVEQPTSERWFRLRTDNPQRLSNELTDLIPEVQVAVSRIEAPRSSADSQPMEAMTQTFLRRAREKRQSQDEELKRDADKRPTELAKASGAAATESVILVIRAGAIPAEAAPSARP